MKNAPPLEFDTFLTVGAQYPANSNTQHANSGTPQITSDNSTLILIVSCKAGLLQDIAQPIHLGQATVEVTASIGVAFYLQNQSTPEQLLKQADEAMYLAKDNGRSRYHMHD